MNASDMPAAPLGDVCRAIAAALLTPDGDVEPPLGRIRLRRHQVEAVRRGRAAIAEFGGVLVADAVGLGKTYTAIGITRHAQSLGVVAPASLCAMWRRALAQCGCDAWVISHESLSRSRSTDRLVSVSALIVDEAHHARNPLTRRYAALARLATAAEVVLLSATPIHNRRRDLHALLALFLGNAAEHLDDAALARCIVRRDHADDAGDARRPSAEPLRWIRLTRHSAVPHPAGTPDAQGALPAHAPANVLDALLAIPPPWPHDDDGRHDAHALVRLGLVRRWASSDAAVRASLRRRLVDAEAMLAALADGRRPTRDELRLWTGHDDAVQLAFTALVASAPAPPGTTLIAAIRAHAQGVRDALGALDIGPDRDTARAHSLNALRRNNPGLPIIAFSTYAHTVEALWRAMPDRSAVAALTADGAVVAGGRLTRDEALRRFAPLSTGVPAPPASQSITLLLATDLLAEGLDLRDAGVVVHLDLPWTGARLEQRVGRARRPASPHESIAVYAMRPPARAETLLRLLATLRRKASLAHDALGGDGWVTMLGAAPRKEVGGDPRHSGADVSEEIRTLLAEWMVAGTTPRSDRMTALIPSSCDGFVALLDTDRHDSILLASNGRGRCSDSPRLVLARLRELDRAMQIGSAPPTIAAKAMEAHTRAALRRIRSWSTAVAALDAAQATGARRRTACARLLAQVARAVSSAPRNERAHVAAAADRARTAIADARGAGAERHFAALLDCEARDMSWLDTVAGTPPSPPRAISTRRHRLRCLVIFVRAR